MSQVRMRFTLLAIVLVVAVRSFAFTPGNLVIYRIAGNQATAAAVFLEGAKSRAPVPHSTKRLDIVANVIGIIGICVGVGALILILSIL